MDAAAPAALPEIMPTRGEAIGWTSRPQSRRHPGSVALMPSGRPHKGQWRGVLPLGHIRTRHRKARALPRMRGSTDSALTTRTAGFVHLRARGAGRWPVTVCPVQHVRHCSAADALALVRDVVMPSSGGGTWQDAQANDEPETRRNG